MDLVFSNSEGRPGIALARASIQDRGLMQVQLSESTSAAIELFAANSKQPQR